MIASELKACTAQVLFKGKELTFFHMTSLTLMPQYTKLSNGHSFLQCHFLALVMKYAEGATFFKSIYGLISFLALNCFCNNVLFIDLGK